MKRTVVAYVPHPEKNDRDKDISVRDKASGERTGKRRAPRILLLRGGRQDERGFPARK